jgi:vitamin B12 transporter
MKAAFLTLAFSLLAVAANAQDTARTAVLDTVIVSATKGAPGQSRSPQPVNVISGEELRATGVTRLADALRRLPSVSVAANGSVGSVTSLFLRGGESRYTKVLIDGVAVNAVGGYFDFSHLTTDNIDRIEVVRGPASVVYGADALSGVVQIFTRRGGDTTAVEAAMRGGSYGTLASDLTISGRGLRRTHYSLAAARHSTDGILPFNNRYHNGTLSSGIRLLASEISRVDLSARYTDAEFHYPTDFAGFVDDSNSYRDQHRLVVGLDAARKVTPRFELRMLAGSNYVSDVTDDIEAVAACPTCQAEDRHQRFTTRTRRRSAEVRGIADLPIGLFTTGAEYVRERERSVAADGPAGGSVTPTSWFAGTRTTRVGFAELASRWRVLDVLLGARLDDPSDFERFVTYRVGGTLTASFARFRTAASTAFNAPAFSQLLPTAFTIGNPDLKPERTRSIEGGVDLRFFGGGARLGITRFHQRFLDLIQFVFGGPPDFLSSYANLAEARASGWEAEVNGATPNGWLLFASATTLDAEITRLDAGYAGPLVVGQRLSRRPRNTATASATYAGWRRGSIGASARRIGRRPDLDFREFPSPVVELKPYTVVDASATLQLTGIRSHPGVMLTARVENLFDRAYQEVLHFDAPGRTILVGARVGFRLDRPAAVSGIRRQ